MGLFLKSFFVLQMTMAFTMNPNSIVNIKVDASKIAYTMRGGMGASWHAISAEFPLDNEKYTIPIREVGARGSAYGGNPPVANEKAWAQLKEHASWLGMNFVRVELSQRMYEPKRQQFDWNNAEMLALYNILDWAEVNDVDVFLQQMWMGVEWNAIPGIHPLISAPKNLDDFANGIATMVEYLLNEKGYTCIKYFCMTNEPPGGTWGYWWEYGDTKGNIADAWVRLKKEFDDRRINIPISGPDWTDMPLFDEERLGMAHSFGAIDIHSYHGVTDEGEQNLRKWAEWSHAQGKPFFLTEYGNMNLGWGGDDPNQKSFEAALSNASDVIRGLRAGVDAFNRWSFTNRGNLDGQWQLVRTFDLESGTYVSEVTPEPEAYYGFAIISRFLSKYASVVSCTIDDPDQKILSAALLSPKGELSIILVNLEEQAVSIDLDLTSYGNKSMQVYQVTREKVLQPGFKLNAMDKFNSRDGKKMVLPAKSITNISSYALENDDKGIIVN
jgi:hypothetical protein